MNKLDDIAKGNLLELDELKSFYSDFQPTFEKAVDTMEKIQPKLLDELCPECGSQLCIRKNKKGQEFIGCSNYPKCKYIKQDNPEPVEDTGIICPNCGVGHIVKKIAKTGKYKGNIFYACDNFPKCKTAYSDIPTSEKCPKCGSIMLKDKDGNLYCSINCASKSNISLEEALKDFRSQTFKKMKIRAYLVFTNKEMENIIKLLPKTIDDLNTMNIFEYNKEDKISKFGQDIVDIVNKYSK